MFPLDIINEIFQTEGFIRYAIGGVIVLVIIIVCYCIHDKLMKS